MRVFYVTVLIVACALASFIFYQHHVADRAVSAIVGEAADQSFDTMVCVAQGIRHRGTLKGVYGVDAAHNADEMEDTWAMARDAWSASAFEKDHIKGAKNWGTMSDLIQLGVPKEQIKKQCGDLYFY